jgi:hypothetical protein
MGQWIYRSRFRDLGTGWRRVADFMPWAFYPKLWREKVWLDMDERKFRTLPGLELAPIGRPPRNQALHRPRYPGSLVNVMCILNIHKQALGGHAAVHICMEEAR